MVVTEPIASTTAGFVRGRRVDGAEEYLGIPFAIAERFAPPRPAPAWEGTRDALAAGPSAPQPGSVYVHGELPDADERGCLNLNVFTPSPDGARPVLVWLHGGGFSMGHGAAGLYRGDRLAVAADAVVVTVNYRLGSLGWLAHPDLAAGPGLPAANWGLLDQIQALRWVRDNIAEFGGDPARVTLAGQSAGALCAMDLMVSPAAAGLFSRVILHSPPLGDVAQEPERGRRWASALIGETGAAGLVGLYELAPEVLVEAQERLLATPDWSGTRGGAIPTLDPATLPASPAAAPGTAPDLDVLIGATADEATFFFRAPWRPHPPPERVPAIVAHLPGVADAGEVLARHRLRALDRGTSTAPLDLLVEIGTDAIVVAPMAVWARDRAAALAGAGSAAAVWRFRVDHPGAGPALGATHTSEVPLLFQTYDDGGAGERLGGQAPGAASVAAALTQAWSLFIHGGSPGWAPLASDGFGDGDGEIGVFGGRSDRAVERGGEV